MFYEYLEKLRSKGKRSFTLEEAQKDLNASQSAIHSAVYRLKRQGKIISPLQGLYIIIPPEHRSLGSIPAEELVPLLMRHLGSAYYVCLLTAAKYYGAAHQKAAVFQIFLDKRMKKTLKFGQVKIECFYKKSIENIPVRDVKVPTGYLKVSSPEVTAMDLLENVYRSGGLNNVATVLSELIETIDAVKLLGLAKQTGRITWLQRFSYILEQLNPMDEDAKQSILQTIEHYVADKNLTLVPLDPKLPIAGFPRHPKWKIIENTTFESDV